MQFFNFSLHAPLRKSQQLISDERIKAKRRQFESLRNPLQQFRWKETKVKVSGWQKGCSVVKHVWKQKGKEALRSFAPVRGNRQIAAAIIRVPCVYRTSPAVGYYVWREQRGHWTREYVNITRFALQPIRLRKIPASGRIKTTAKRLRKTRRHMALFFLCLQIAKSSSSFFQCRVTVRWIVSKWFFTPFKMLRV